MSTSQRSALCIAAAYFSVYHYTKCVSLKADCATLKRKMCTIKFVRQDSNTEQLNAY